MRRIALVAAMAAMVAGTACSTLGRQSFKQPEVAFKDVKVNGVGLSGGSLDIVLSVYNPNRFRLDATRMTYKLEVDSVPFGTGATDRKFTVKDRDSTEVRLPLDFKWAGLGQAGRDIMSTGTVNYHVSGDITVGSEAGTFTLPYDRVGRFSALGGNSR